MTLVDRLLDRLEDAFRHEPTQRRIQEHLLDPAAAYLARKLFRYTACFGLLLLVQLLLLVVLLARAFNFSLAVRQ